jgi:hypothetical protein
MHRTFFYLFSVLALLLGGLQPAVANAGPPAEAAPPPGVAILRSDASGITLRIRPPAYRITPIALAGRLYDRVEIPGYGLSRSPGRPALPEAGILLGIPAGGEPALTIVRDEPTRQQLASGARVAPAAAYEVVGLPDDATREDGMRDGVPLWEAAPGVAALRGRTVEDAGVYAAAALFPAASAEIVETGYLRDQRYVKLAIHPVQYAPVTGEIVFHRELEVRLDFRGVPATQVITPARPESAVFEALLRRTILNYDAAAAWRAAPPTVDAHSNPPDWVAMAPAAAGTIAWKIAVSQAGIYRLTHDDLLAAGVLQGNPDPRTFKLVAGGTEIPVIVTGEEDGAFNPGDLLLFYGQPARTRYTDANIYWLTVGGAAGRRMAERPAPPAAAGQAASFRATLHREQNVAYVTYLPRRPDHEHWFWNYTLAGSVPAQSYTFTLAYPVATPYTATLRLAAVGRTASGHRIQVKVNHQLAGQADWDGLDEQRLTFDFPSSFFIAGQNRLTITAPGSANGSADQTYYDWFEIDYRRAFTVTDDTLAFTDDQPAPRGYALAGFTAPDVMLLDVTDSLRPVRLTGGLASGGGPFSFRFEDAAAGPAAYIASAAPLRPASLTQDKSSALRDHTNRADYLIISHADFLDAMQSLADYRASQGLRVQLIDVQDIYDEFNGGVMAPEAIHDFLTYAYASWTPPAPTYVLLVGEGNYDPKHYRATTRRTYIPPYLAPVDPWMYQAPAENWFVTVSGDDDLPDMLLGRFPVGNAAQAQWMGQRVIAYEQSAPPGDWQRSTLWVTDNAPDPAGDFYAISDSILNAHLPANYSAERVYLAQNYPYENPSVAAKAAVSAAVNRGQVIVSYTGHGAYNYWASEKLLSATEALTLTNGGRLPVWLAMTCWTGSFHAPDSTLPSALDVELVRSTTGGAIATFSPTGLGAVYGHDFLHRGFLDALFQTALRQMGQAALAAKLNLYTNSGQDFDLLNTFAVLGDPALRIAVAAPAERSYGLYVPLVVKP